MRGYVSVDIETTGIHQDSEILQISAVYDDLVTEVAELRMIDLPVKHEVLGYCEPYAIGMNADLFKKMMNKDFISYNPETSVKNFIHFLLECQETMGLDEKGKPRKVILAGKNVSSFDIPKLRNFIKKHGRGSGLEEFDRIIHYKTLDVGSLYFDIFRDNVSLSEINKLTKRAAVSHNALEDALDVVYAVRHKLEITNV
jgi:hypothetical protein